MKRVYLDYAAATPVDRRVMDAMQPYFSEKFYNPSALYKGAREASVGLEKARDSVAKSIGSRSSEVIFTAGGTESANLAILGVSKAFPGGEVLVSSIEHDAVLKPANTVNAELIKVYEDGIVDLDDLKSRISAKTILISAMYSNNEIGSLQPIKQIVQIANQERERRKKHSINRPLYVHTDACQAPLYLDVNVARLGVDLMTLNGGKMNGPKQSGILYVKAGTRLDPVTYGGGQEFGYRGGTENVAFAVGFAKALELAGKGKNERIKTVSQLRDYFMSELENRFRAEITGSKKQRIANNIHAIFPGSDNERVLFALDDLGIDAATGSACSASSDTPSHVLLALDKTDEEARASLRFSLGADTTRGDIEFALEKLSIALQA